jgi:hypothetical protein
MRRRDTTFLVLGIYALDRCIGVYALDGCIGVYALDSGK